MAWPSCWVEASSAWEFCLYLSSKRTSLQPGRINPRLFKPSSDVLDKLHIVLLHPTQRAGLTGACSGHFPLYFIKIPFSYSSKARRSSSWVFITIGPYQATGSPIGLPHTKTE